MVRVTLLLIFTALLSVSCTEKIFVGDDMANLEFSDDTIHFDTVFTTLGSTTRELRIYNNNSKWLKVDRISLGGGTDSPFRVNIDGDPSYEVYDIEMAPGDSIFVFIDVIIDPVDENSPVAVLDSIVFETGNSVQAVNLLAWGQDIHLLSGEIVGTGTWGNDKPWVIYNYVMVDTGAVLTIEAGTHLFFHRGAGMLVAGTLIVNGEYENRVVFSSDRTEESYAEIPGQWEGLYLLNTSSDNIIDNAFIINAVSGIQTGILGSQYPPPDLRISNSIIRNMTVTGMASLGGNITAFNCEISHCGFFNLFLVMGGSYKFTHCTVAGSWEYSARRTPSVLVSDFYDYEDIHYVGELEIAEFTNSIIYGSREGEIEIVPDISGGILNCDFNYSLMTVDRGSAYWDDYDLSTALVNYDPGFIGFSDLDFRPDTLSVLTGAADRSVSLSYPYDIRGFERLADEGPDIGAYERQPGEKKDTGR